MGELPVKVSAFFEEIRKALALETLPILQYDDTSVAIAVSISVFLPTRSTIDGIDIRETEPILIQVDVAQFPNVIPLVRSDRDDFPRSKLSHLYVGPETEPAALCLVRNNRHEWFASKSAMDLLTITRQWYFKAAIGKLADDNDEWDPARITFNGYHIFPYNTFYEIVKNKEGFKPGDAHAFLMAYVYKNDYQHKDNLTYRSLFKVPIIVVDEIKKIIEAIDEKTEATMDIKPHLSILAWDPEDKVDTRYYTTFPTTYGGLKTFVLEHGVNLDEIIYKYREYGLHLLNGIPFVLAVKRPKKMIGYDGDYEFFAFRISGKNFDGINFPDDSMVVIQSHIEPFTKELAWNLSGEKRDDRTLYVGAGSLGSKMMIHDARSGKTHIAVVDADNLLQHNLVRHGLFENKVGLNKAEAIVKEIKSLFRNDSTAGLIAKNNRIHNVFTDLKDNYDWLVDTTASISSQNFLITANVPRSMKIAKAEIADQGRLGFLFVEGRDRNPRLDDMVNLSSFHALRDRDIEAWRRRDAKSELVNLSVGLGCSSSTLVMSDDIISYHAALFSKTLQNISQRKTIGDAGLIYISKISIEGIPSTATEAITVNPLDSYYCLDGSRWEIRMLSSVRDKLFELCHRKRPVETGGILIGMASYKTRTIHVFDITDEPEDSLGTCTGFIRGTKNMPELVNHIKETTGDIIGYIGEWHTHPMNLESLSATDRNTIEILKQFNRKKPIPTFSIVVTRDKILPFVSE